jgi:hypothetical protein
MIRVVLEIIVLFLLPTAVYLAYAFLAREEGATSRLWDGAPVVWLIAAGAALAFTVLIAFGDTSGGRPGEIYVPPEVKDGKIIPGHFKPAPEPGKK